MVTIKEYLVNLNETKKKIEIASLLSVSPSMISQYMLHNYNPSLDVAKIVYKMDKVVLHPYSEESIIKEIEDELE